MNNAIWRAEGYYVLRGNPHALILPPPTGEDGLDYHLEGEGVSLTLPGPASPDKERQGTVDEGSSW